MAINPQINDMAWFGKPADPVDSFQKGMNLAEQSQRMKQSADMHPLKMADLQSATAARDASTNLSKQSYDFNELTKADRASSVNALARLQQVSAGIAENTQEAVESLKKSQAWNQKRSDKITKKVDIELEVQAREAERNRVITNQWVNEKTKQGQVDQFNQRTNLLGQQARAAQLQNDVNYANKTLLTEARSAALQNQLNNFEALQYQYGQEQAGRQPLQESMLTMNALASSGRYDELDNLPLPQGLTTAQKKQWLDHRAAVKNNKAGMDYENAVKASTANQVQTITGAQEYAGKIAEMGLGTIDANGVLQIDPKNLERVNRYTEQRKLLDQMQGDETKALMDALGATNEMDVFGAPAGGLGGGAALLDPSKGMSLKGMASMHGTRHGDDILLSDQGLRRLKNIVNKRNKEVAFADDNRRLQAQLTQLQALGQRVKGAAIKDGKVELTTEAGRMTADQQQSAVRQMYETLAKAATDAGQEFTQAELMGEARRQVFASTLPSASSAAELRGLGIRDGVPYWNPIAKNDDGTVGGVRIAGEPDVNTGHNALGPLKGANAGGPTQPQGGGTDLSDIMQLTGMPKKKADLFKGDGQSGNNRDNRDAAPVLMQELTQYATPEVAAYVIRRAYEAGGVDYDPDKESASVLTQKVYNETESLLRSQVGKLTKLATGSDTGQVMPLSVEQINELMNSIGKPASDWPLMKAKGNVIGGGIDDITKRLNAGNVAKLEPALEEYRELMIRQEGIKSLLTSLTNTERFRSDPNVIEKDGRFSSPYNPKPPAPKPKNNIKRLTEAEARKRFPELYQDDK